MNNQSTTSQMSTIQHVLEMLKDLENFDKDIKQQYPHLDRISYLFSETLSKSLNIEWHSKLNDFFATLVETCTDTHGARKIAVLSGAYIYSHLGWVFDAQLVQSYSSFTQTCLKDEAPGIVSLVNAVIAETDMFKEFVALVDDPTPNNILLFKLKI